MAAMGAIASALAPRAMVLIGLLGGFTLALLAVLDPTGMKLAAAGIYDILVFMPLLGVTYLRG